MLKSGQMTYTRQPGNPGKRESPEYKLKLNFQIKDKIRAKMGEGGEQQ